MDNIFIENHPIMNINSYKTQNLLEEKFAESFNRYYANNFIGIHGLRDKYTCDTIREIPISNLGIADMISISWRLNSKSLDKLKQNNCAFSNFTLRAFEFKMNNWKKGMMQAHRYSYFSHSTILVIPTEILGKALKGLDTFKKLNVGLWGFDLEKEVVNKVFTPRPNKKYIDKYFSQVTDKAHSFLTESVPIV